MGVDFAAGIVVGVEESRTKVGSVSGTSTIWMVNVTSSGFICLGARRALVGGMLVMGTTTTAVEDCLEGSMG